MDGVEYIDATIFALIDAFPKEHYEVRVDANVFVPGESLRANIIRELGDAEIVLALLDGLRPNVIYELGIAHSFERRLGGANDGKQCRVVPLAEINATVLVRNFYPDPLSIPMIDGSRNTPLNPRLDLATAWSDGSDILVQRYDRLHLQRDIRNIVGRLLQSFGNEPSKGAVVAEAIEEAEPAEKASAEGEPVQKNVASASKESDPQAERFESASRAYQKGNYDEVIELSEGFPHPKLRKLRALSFMRRGRISEAIKIWEDLVQEPGEMKSAVFHLGVCNYVINELVVARSLFQTALEGDYGESAKTWLERTNAKLQRPTSRSTIDGATQ